MLSLEKIAKYFERVTFRRNKMDGKMNGCNGMVMDMLALA